MDKRQELTEINQQRKELVRRQKELLRELNDSKGERVEAKKIIAEKRKAALASKVMLRSLLADMKEALKSKDSAEINSYIETLAGVCAGLLKLLEEFSANIATHEEL